MEPAPRIDHPREPGGNSGGMEERAEFPQAERPSDNGNTALEPGRKPPPQQKSRVVKAGEKRSKKGKRRMHAQVQPPTLGPDDYVAVIPVPKRSEVLGPQTIGWRPVTLSTMERAPQIELDDTLTSATAWKGYRTVRATHGACQGSWYYEATMSHLGFSGHVRLGWSTRKGELQAPVGYDECSYGYRDLEGSKVHKAWREDYGEAFQEGDVIGCYLHLGNGGRPFEMERSDIVTWKGGLFYEVKPNADEPQIMPDSFVGFTKNGVWQGAAYRGLSEGTYYPAVSIFTLPTQEEKATVAVNFGPSFKYAVPDAEGCPAATAVSTLAGEPPKPQGSEDAVNMVIDRQEAPTIGFTGPQSIAEDNPVPMMA